MGSPLPMLCLVLPLLYLAPADVLTVPATEPASADVPTPAAVPGALAAVPTASAAGPTASAAVPAPAAVSCAPAAPPSAPTAVQHSQDHKAVLARFAVGGGNCSSVALKLLVLRKDLQIGNC